MCGRFVRYSSVHQIMKEFDVEDPFFELHPGYNIAPGQEVAIIINDGKKRLTLCRWGFIPSWAKDPSVAYKMINARSESVADKPSLRGAFRSGRILVIADGFYEWKKEGRVKIPVFIYLKSRRPFGFAGLFNLWISPRGERICTCTIITTEANRLLLPIHNRMPVILHKEYEDQWLNPAQGTKELLSLLKPYPSNEMDYYPVSTLVNSPANNSPECIKPI